tara:strand:- start:20021 stop:21541 length:1521 start_codon:yes stop_codon:yes gene_type:complete
MKPGRRTFGYCRVSSTEQRQEGVSLEVQEDAVHDYARSIGCEVAPKDMIVVAESASKAGTRPVFLEMLASARSAPGSVIIFDRVDRSARNHTDTAMLLDGVLKGVFEVHFARERIDTSTPAGRMMWSVLAGHATFETDGRSVEIRRARHRLARAGAYLNCPPFGYSRDRVDGIPTLTPNGEPAEAVRRAFDLFAFGSHLTVEAIADRLHQEGFVYKPPKRPAFSKQALGYILKNRVYLGMVKDDSGNFVAGKHAPLIDAHTFERAQERFRPPKRTKQDHLFGACIVTCGVCGRSVTCEAKHKPTQAGPKTYRFYRCADQTCEGSRPPFRQPERALEAHVRAFFSSMRFASEEMRSLFTDVLRRKTTAAQDAARQRIARLQKRLSEIQEGRRQTIRFGIKMGNSVRQGDLAAELDRADHDESAILSQLCAEGRTESDQGQTAIKAFELSQALEERWDRADLVSRRLILSLVSLNLVLRAGGLDIEPRPPFSLLLDGAVVGNGRSDRI